MQYPWSFLAEPYIKPQSEIMEMTWEPSWMDPIIAYLKNGKLPEEKTEAHILRLKLAHYVLYNEKLYRRGYLMPLLKYILPMEAKNIMWEIHEGICENHARKQSLAFKALRQGYYWPTMKVDCMRYAQRRQVPTVLTSVKSPSRRAYFNDEPMVVCHLGDWSNWSTPQRNRQRAICCSGYWLLHQMGRSRSHSIHQAPQNQGVHL